MTLSSAYKKSNSFFNGREYSTARTLVSLVTMAFLLNYVESMVIPSIPALQVHFRTSTALSSWLISAFLITASVAAPLFGRLGDNYGKKKMLLITLTIYTAGVGLAGFSTSMSELIFARALQGVGFGGIPLAFAIITDKYPPEKLPAAMGIMSAFFATGGVTGLIAGSYIIAYAGWQWAFHSALIVSIVVIAAILINLDRDLTRERERIDYLGAILLTSSITLLLLYITRGPSIGWTSLINLELLGIGIFLGIMFMLQERRAEEPLVHLKLMSQRNMSVSNVVGFLSLLLMQVLFLSLVYFTNDPTPLGDGYSNIQTGLILAPGALAMAIVGPLIGRVMRRTGPKPIIMLGTALLAIGLSVFLTDRSSIIGLIISGIGAWTGLVSIFVPVTNMVAMAMPSERRAIGLGTNMMLRSVGGSIGPAFAASVMTVYSGSAIVSAGSSLDLPVTQSFPTAPAFDLLMIVGLVLVGIIFLVNLMTKNYTFNKKEGPRTQ